jgi:hypothetical protein
MGFVGTGPNIVFGRSDVNGKKVVKSSTGESVCTVLFISVENEDFLDIGDESVSFRVPFDSIRKLVEDVKGMR